MSGQFNVNLRQFIFAAGRLLQGGSAAGPNASLGQGALPNTPLGAGQMGPGVGLNRLSLAQLFQNESFRMNNQELASFMKDTMKLPQELKLMMLAVALEGAPAELKELAQQPLQDILKQLPDKPSIPLDDLQQLLGQNTKEASDKLMKLLQTAQLSQTQGAPQLAELSSTLTKLGEKIKASPQEAAETLILLYLPWYPLASDQKLTVDFEFADGDGAETLDDVSVILYLDTATLGRFRVLVSEQKQLQMLVLLTHEEQATPMLDPWKMELNAYLAQEGLPASTFTAERFEGKTIQAPSTEQPTLANQTQDSTGFKGATRQQDVKKLSVKAGSRVSLLVMNIAYFMARLIFEADEQNRLLQRSRQR